MTAPPPPPQNVPTPPPPPPVPPPKPQPAAKPQAPPPLPKAEAGRLPLLDGFTFNTVSGLYVQTVSGTDESGAPGEWVTYYHPVKGEFKQIFYPPRESANPWM
ncbi:MAG: hypothetical protein LBI19_04930 [Oscillospiraceae bacterium]|jgi:hypothetical protein|nr:hypothetical protein [Oscillospiraceae bacterium]